MAEPFKSTPASRVFGMGLPRRKVDNPGTIFGIEVDEPRWSIDPRLRRDMMQEQGMAMEEQALDAQKAQLDRQRRVMQAEDQAIMGLEQGEEIGNIFKNNPSLALSRNFGQFANMAEMARPSKAAQAMIPSLAMKLPIEERGVFNELVNQPEFANNPFAAYDEAQRRGSRSKQHGELVKAGVPLAKIDQTKDYSPIEFEDLVRQHKKPETGNDFTDKLVQQAWSGFDENYMPPEGVDDPVEIAIDMADKKNSIRQRIMEKYGAAPAIPGAATATNITSPAAMGGVAPTQLAPAVEAQKPLIDINAQLESLPFAEQKAFLEKKNAEEAAQKEIAPAWDKAKTDIEKQILKVVPDKPLPGTKVNELESFAKAVLNPNENIITHPEYGTIPVAWDILNKAGVPMADIMTNKTVFRQPGEGRRLFGVIGTQQVGYQELLKEWAKSFLNSRGKLLPTSQSPSGSTLTEQQQKDLDELSSLVRSK